MKVNERVQIQFQFLIGSLGTVAQMELLNLVIYVSIPYR